MPVTPERDSAQHGLSLLCRVKTRCCALPIDHVVEVMRALPVEPLAGSPPFVRGVAIIRGVPVPVVDAAVLLGAGDSHPTHFVTVKVDDRRVALAVDAVLGVKGLAPESLHDVAPLLRAAGSDVVSALGVLDTELLVVLRDLRIVPDSLWAELAAAESAP